MKVEIINNDAFKLLTVQGKDVKVRALPMSDAVAWAALATKARNDIAAAVDYAEMRDAMAEAAAVLGEYPDLAADVLTQCSVEQITGALDALLEVNDPFVRRRRRAEAEAEKRQARELEIMAKMPPETIVAILKENTPAVSAALAASSE